MNFTSNITFLEPVVTTEEEQSLIRYDMLLVALSSILIGIVISCLKEIFYFIIVCFFNRWETIGARQCETMDEIMTKGFCESRQLTHSSLPANGKNVYWVNGLVITFRQPSVEREENGRGFNRISKHVIWCFRFTNSSKIIKEQLLGHNDDNYTVTYVGEDGVEMPLQKSDTSSPCIWQLYVANCVCDLYEEHGNVVLLICGPIGFGKTWLAELVGKVLADRLKVKSNIRIGRTLANIDFNGIPQGTKQKPVIFVNDEFDCCITHAEKAEEKSKKKESLAHNFSTLATTLDVLNKLQNFIFFATSNKSIKELSETREGAYIREGRIRVKFQLEIDPETGICHLRNIKSDQPLEIRRENVIIVEEDKKEHVD
jgi:hypothetical protein